MVYILAPDNTLGHLSDPSALAHSSLPTRIANGECNFPAPQALPGTDVVLPHFFVCDEIFALRENFMKPSSRRLGLNESQKAFNFRHSRGRMPSECTFDNMDKKLEVLDSPLRFDLDVTKDVIVTIMCLNNYLITGANPELQDFGAGLPEGFDLEANPAYHPLVPTAIRNELAQFFSPGGAGHLP
ncbi:hypothetical protein QAD02_000648 [Eretmocerus hayati]|uniref:Uncharacterized protein n=1 Tax=Eretmocerus hayati TaxID=131215 RepID=A0ACC2NE94_9HYME|nr:hypothetical protein QAD02_000648 [Eretmocerus hayati]